MSLRKIKNILKENEYVKVSKKDMIKYFNKYGIELENIENENYEMVVELSIKGYPTKEQRNTIDSIFKSKRYFVGMTNPKDLIFIYRFSKLVELV